MGASWNRIAYIQAITLTLTLPYPTLPSNRGAQKKFIPSLGYFGLALYICFALIKI